MTPRYLYSDDRWHPGPAQRRLSPCMAHLLFLICCHRNAEMQLLADAKALGIAPQTTQQLLYCAVQNGLALALSKDGRHYYRLTRFGAQQLHEVLSRKPEWFLMV